MKIIKFPTRKAKAKRMSEEDQLLTDLRGKMTSVLVIGRTSDDEIYFASTMPSTSAILLTERFKYGVLTGEFKRPDDE